MRTRGLIRLAIAVCLTGMASAAFSVALAASAEDFKAAYAKAAAVDKQSVAMQTEWTTTVEELKAAKKAAAAGKYDEAVKRAKHAEALANASIAQAKAEKKLWTQAIVR